MNYIVKKAGMSMLTGAAYMMGSWLTKRFLEETCKNIDNLQKQKNKTKDEEKTTPA